MTYDEFRENLCFTGEELLAFSQGKLVDDPPEGFLSRLPAPPLLMLDRITMVGTSGQGGWIAGEQDLNPDAWYFRCHLPNDPVHPACLYTEAIWQLLGFYCSLQGVLGVGRAIGCGEIHLLEEIRPSHESIHYEVLIKRICHLKENNATYAIGDGRISLKGKLIGQVSGAKVGFFKANHRATSEKK
jgi:3-hydroxyacyl-[acyl-carrier protein] dehydratase/trans-2-decenoyl-[acyl-carrier protein] isomerase